MSGAAAPPPSSRGRGFVRGALRPLGSRGAAGPPRESAARARDAPPAPRCSSPALQGGSFGTLLPKRCGRSAGQRQRFTPDWGSLAPALAAAGGQRDRPRCRPFVAAVKGPFERGAGPRSLREEGQERGALCRRLSPAGAAQQMFACDFRSPPSYSVLQCWLGAHFPPGDGRESDRIKLKMDNSVVRR